MASAKDVLKRIKDEEIEWVDLRFTDPKGKWQHLTMVASVIGEDELEEGLMFDGSSIRDRLPSAPRSTYVQPVLQTQCSSAPRPSSIFSTTSASRIRRTGLLRVWLTSGLLHGCGARKDVDHAKVLQRAVQS